MLPLSNIQLCELCTKPLKQGNAYKRHLNYCRKRQHQQRTRKQPCRACQIAKVKCDGSECKRCLRKGIICSSGSQYLRSNHNETGVGHVLSNQDKHLLGSTEAFAADDAAFFDALNADDLELLNLTNQENDVLFADSTNLLDSSLMLPPGDRDPSSLPQPYHLHIEPNQDWSFIFHLDPYASALIPNDVDKWVLSPAPMPNALADNHSRRLIRMLRSIPRMMVRRENFPPFIHSHWQHDLPGPLANCMTIARLFCKRNSSNSTLVWNTIRLEQERLARETYDFSKEELMAGLQAYLVYMIMRAEDDTGQTAGDVPMLFSLKALTDWCYHLFGGYPLREESQYDPKLTWETWIFRESQRRCAILYFLIGRVFNVFTGNVCPCTSDPLKLPLPAPRSVWEARTENDWLIAYQGIFRRERPTTFGELLQEMHAPTTKLEEWQCEMDYLGSLLESAVGTFK